MLINIAAYLVVETKDVSESLATKRRCLSCSLNVHGLMGRKVKIKAREGDIRKVKNQAVIIAMGKQE